VWNISGISAAPLFALQKRKIPYAIHLFDRCFSFTKKAGWKRILNLLLSNRLQANHLISCSESLKADYLKQGFNGDCITVIPHGIAPEWIPEKRKKLNCDKLNLLFVGQLWEAKGVDLAIRCLALLPKRKITATLSIIGDGKEKYKKYLRKVIEECGIKDRVVFVGGLPREQLKDYYRTHDILLFPTYSWYKEPFGIVILEAMNQGIPVIASDCGGPSEIITNGENGLLFESGNTRSLGDQIEKIVNDPNLYADISIKGFESTKNKYDISIVGEKIIDYYEKAL
jgi:glycosyltransferase involved in cell wall biosynthesis